MAQRGCQKLLPGQTAKSVELFQFCRIVVSRKSPTRTGVKTRAGAAVIHSYFSQSTFGSIRFDPRLLQGSFLGGFNPLAHGKHMLNGSVSLRDSA